MGLFPILMNILQFWLIDSIVKASEEAALVLQSDSSRPSYEHGQHEPLFGVPSDDEDDDANTGSLPLPQHDIENPRPRSKSRDNNKRSTPDEQKSITSGTTAPGVSSGGTSVPMHAYPPSIKSAGSSTPSSSRTSSMSPSSETSHKYKRSTPTTLRLHSAHVPAINSPERPSTHPTLTPKPSNSAVVVTEQDPNSWASWDDSDDWANRVGEDEWTGRRLEHKKNELSEAWGPSPVAQQQQRIGVVGS